MDGPDSVAHSLRLDHLASVSAERASVLAADLASRALARDSGAAAGSGGASAASADSGEAAGLVPYKTSPHEDLLSPGDVLVTFDQESQNETRIKRLRSKVWLDGYLHNMVRPGHRGDQPWFVTLTYRGVEDWRPDHMSIATERYRRWCRRRGVPCRYTWVAELQQRGAVHYHLMCWLPRGVRMPKWDRQTTHRGRQCVPFWTHGMCNRQAAKQGIAYLMKYLSKMGKYHQFPRGCRTHSSGGLDSHGRLIREWSSLPHWVKCLYGVGELVRVDGRLHEIATGAPLEPLYSRKFIRHRGKCVALVLTPLRGVPERFHDGPYSSIYPETGYTNSE